MENDILKLMASSFPMTSTEISKIINRDEKAIVIAAMIYLREFSGDKMQNAGEVLEALRELNS